MRPTRPSDTLTPYFQLMAQRPALFAQTGYPRIITDRDAIKAYIKKTGTPIGVLYESHYNLLVVDLVSGPDGSLYPYERVLPATASGAVVIVPLHEGRFVLLRQYRHSVRDFLWAFPRGFGEPGITVENNAAKELSEELGVSPAVPLRRLGRVIADSGLYACYADVFTCPIPAPVIRENYEGIQTVRAVTAEEFTRMVRQGEITDGYTLAAWELYE